MRMSVESEILMFPKRDCCMGIDWRTDLTLRSSNCFISFRLHVPKATRLTNLGLSTFVPRQLAIFKGKARYLMWIPIVHSAYIILKLVRAYMLQSSLQEQSVETIFVVCYEQLNLWL
jgi:hypothetical protein